MNLTRAVENRSVSSPIEEAPHIVLKNVSMAYQSKKGQFLAVESVDMVVPRNSFISIIGPSGCGKSSLLKVVSKVVPPSGGEVLINGLSIDEVDLTGKLSFMFQQSLLLPWRTVLENVLLPIQIVHGKVDESHREDAVRLLTVVGLGSSLERRPYELSGGMRQRAALARALITNPEILLMDEPFGAVDEITREVLQEELLRIWQGTGTTILLVTHQVAEAALMGDRVVVMSEGPGTVLETVEISQKRPRTSALRQSPEFHRDVDYLRGLLRPSNADQGDSVHPPVKPALEGEHK